MTEHGVLHQKSKDFGKLPAKLMHDETVTDGAKVLYAHMHWRYGSNHKNFESLKSMAKQLGVSDQTIVNRIHELEAAEWIVTIKRTTPETHTFLSNVYHVFEVQGEATRFRNQFKNTENEEIVPITSARVRKSRKGKGGKPQNLQPAPIQVGTDSMPIQVGTDEPTQVGTIQTQVIQMQLDAATDETPNDGSDTLRPTPEQIVQMWLKTAAKHAPLVYSHPRCLAAAATLLGTYPALTLDDVRICTLTQCKNRTTDYMFSFLVEDLSGYMARKAVQPAPAPQGLDDFSKYRLEMMKQEKAEREAAS